MVCLLVFVSHTYTFQGPSWYAYVHTYAYRTKRKPQADEHISGSTVSCFFLMIET